MVGVLVGWNVVWLTGKLDSYVVCYLVGWSVVKYSIYLLTYSLTHYLPPSPNSIYSLTHPPSWKFSRNNEKISSYNENISRYYENISSNNEKPSRNNENISRNNEKLSRYNENISRNNEKLFFILFLSDPFRLSYPRTPTQT